MAESQQKSKSEKVKADSASRRSSKSINARRLFEDAQYNYMQALQEAWREAQQNTAKIHQSHAQAMHELQAETQKLAWETHQNHLKAVHDATGAEDEQKRIGEAQQAYTQAQQEMEAEAKKRAWEAEQSYAQALHEDSTQGNLQERFEEAYRTYLHALSQAWTQLDVESLDPEALAAISHSAASVALSASQILGTPTSAGR